MLTIITSIISLFKIAVTALIFFLLIRWISGLFSTKSYNYGNQGASYSQKNEDTITTSTTPKGKKINLDEGEYVDYEEVE